MLLCELQVTEHTIGYEFSLPRTNDLIDALCNRKVYSSLDLPSEYWWVKIHPEGIPKTAFSTQ